MEDDLGGGWPARLATVIAGEMRRYRLNRKMSVQQLADECSDLGLPMKRSVLANLESGRRETVTVAELLALARVLHVPPVALVFPLGHSETFEVLPGKVVPTWDAAGWFTGEIVRVDEAGQWTTIDDHAIEMFRRHAHYSHEAAQAKGRGDTQALRLAGHALWEVRAAMRRLELAPPDLPAWLADVVERARS